MGAKVPADGDNAEHGIKPTGGSAAYASGRCSRDTVLRVCSRRRARNGYGIRFWGRPRRMGASADHTSPLRGTLGEEGR